MMRWLPFVICCAVLTWGLFRPTPPPDPFAHSDKVGHFLAFTALGLTARLAFLRAPAWQVWGILLLMAPVLEWLQHQVSPMRQLSLGDAAANVLGVLLSCLVWSLITWGLRTTRGSASR